MALRVIAPLVALAAMMPGARAQYPGQASPYGGRQYYQSTPSYAAPMAPVQGPGMNSWYTAHPEARAAVISQCGRSSSGGDPGCALATSSAQEEAERREWERERELAAEQSWRYRPGYGYGYYGY